jgi:hypothetical protein
MSVSVSTRAISLTALIACAMLAGCGDDARKTLGLGKNPPDEFQVVGRAPLSIPPDYSLRPPTPGAARPQEPSMTDTARNAVLGTQAAAPGAAAASGPAPTQNTQTASMAPLSDPPAPAAAPRTPVAAGSLGGAPPATLASAMTPGVLSKTAAITGAKAAPGAVPAVATIGTATAGQIAPPSVGEQVLLDKLGANQALPNIRTLLTEELTKLAVADESTIDSLLWWKKPQPVPKVLDPTAESQRLQENAALGRPVNSGESPSIKRVSKSFLEGIF